jgi:tRNA(Ile2) C34 agmatinyltransferase TiaS
VVVSGILNCVCPECGGRMGEAGKEFKCQGKCQTDWRRAWEQALAAEFDIR